MPIATGVPQAYTRARTRFGMLASTLQLVALLAFWFAGGFGWLDRAHARARLRPGRDRARSSSARSGWRAR